MIKNLPKYYNIAAINTMSDDLLVKRSNAINQIIETMELSWVLDCIRFYLNRPVTSKGFRHDFFLVFNEHDNMFLEDGGDLEKQILAGAIIGEYLEVGAEKQKIAYALKSGIFGIDKEQLINTDIIEAAIDYLNQQSIEKREVQTAVKAAPKILATIKDEIQTLETLTQYVKNQFLYNRTLAAYNDERHSILIQRIKVLEEESNIHWWLFRSYSTTLDCSVAQLNTKQAIFILSSELDDLTTIVPEPINADAFLKKMWSNIVDSSIDVSLEDIVNEWHSNLRGKTDGNVSNLTQYSGLTPLHFAFSKISETEGDGAWTTPFTKISGIASDIKFTPYEFSRQFLTELSLSYC